MNKTELGVMSRHVDWHETGTNVKCCAKGKVAVAFKLLLWSLILAGTFFMAFSPVF